MGAWETWLKVQSLIIENEEKSAAGAIDNFQSEYTLMIVKASSSSITILNSDEDWHKN